MKRTLCSSTLMLVLAGCASVQPPTGGAVPVAVPTAWAGAPAASAATASSLEQWWQRFDDAALSQLVTQALQHNTSVASALGALRQARAQRDATAAGLSPSVGTSASAQRSKTGHAASVNVFNAGVDASWEPDLYGTTGSAVAAGDATVGATVASLGDVQVSVSAEVALNYIALRSGQARLLIAEANLSSQLETLQITQWRLQAGLVTSVEAEQAQTSVEQLRALLPGLQTTIAQSRHALAVLTGQPPAALDAALAAVAPVPEVDGDLALSMPAETLRQRPDVRAAELQARAAWWQVDAARAAGLPSFRLSGSLGLSALTLGSLTSGGALAGALLAGVSWPLFDGGAADAQVRAQQAALEQARSAYQSAVLTALQDVEDALVALRGDRERLLRLQAAATSATNAAQLARQRYSGGLVDFQTVLDTQRSQLSTQDSVASAHADVAADHVRLFKALGGGWQPTPDLAADLSKASSETS